MTICEFCLLNVLESKKSWDYHHTEAVDFEHAAKSGCVFCKKLVPSQGSLQSWFEHKDEMKALYRWNIREAIQTRDTKSYVSITFRPVPGRENGGKKSEELPELRFDLFPEEGLGPIPKEEDFGKRTNSDASIAKMKKWLDDCGSEKGHPKCLKHNARRSGSSSFMPSRVLDVGAPGDLWPPSRIRVVETKKEKVEGQYMTLSHCWGQKPNFVMLTSGTIKDFTNEGIPWNNTTTGKGICSNDNFSDAIEITRNLGVRYLWIDSICIIQGDTVDLKTEVNRMRQVYRNSFCNLAAAVSINWEGGLFRERNSNVLPVRYAPKSSLKRFSGQNWRILPSDLWDKDLLGSHLYTRGWVFQERMLSPRLLQFGCDQIFWDCATISACEALPGGLPPSLDARAGTDRHWRQRLQDTNIAIRSLVKSSEGSPEKFWESTVSAYTACNLTNHDDKDDALWGIAKLVRDMLGEEYAYGLWSLRLEQQLAWRVVGNPAVEYPKSKKKFPSWSWTSLKGQIQVASRTRDDRQVYCVTNHEGGRVGFQFEKALWGWIEGEHFPVWNLEIGKMTNKLNNIEKERAMREKTTGMTEASNMHRLDERSTLKCDKIAVLGHICKGKLQKTPGDNGWAIAMTGIRKEAIIEAYPDIQPQPDKGSCKFLVLAVSRLITDKSGDEVLDPDEMEDDEIGDVMYSGVGIMVEGDDEKALRRVGAVEFRELCQNDWYYFRMACGETEKTFDHEFDAGDGKKVWLA